jgi:hypothetical protein
MATLSPEVDIAAVLVAATTVFSPALAMDTDIKYGPPRAPLSAGNTARIWIIPYGGQEPDPLINAAVDGSIYYSKVQIVVRGLVEDYMGSLTLARKIRDALHTKHPSTYISLRALSSEPIYLGIDEINEHRWTISFEAMWRA